MAVRGSVNVPKSNISVWWLLGLSVLTEAFEPQRPARTTRRIVSCETPESSATLRRDAFFSSTRCNTVGYSEAGIPFAGFFVPDLRSPGCRWCACRRLPANHRAAPGKSSGVDQVKLNTGEPPQLAPVVDTHVHPASDGMDTVLSETLQL